MYISNTARKASRTEGLKYFWLVLSLSLSHLGVRSTDSSSSFAVEYVDAALTVILQRRSNCHLPESVGVKIRQHSERGAKPSVVRRIPSQYQWRIQVTLDILVKILAEESQCLHGKRTDQFMALDETVSYQTS